ncbi:FHA domain-containing protein FhaB/FipA [Subtercola boreus]|uniref:FHA domain-containing protein n=1 Tax=Subtercola boreus TaxID=120213 RepID=A0A3E0WH41_9MICO|nr:FHA domain-containing protein [Subtercola boreus]RFA23461.1 FHA domain-containing protein [Subtercola boreus]RFA23854.1 FHA domain-containing protein [Subtercola boreus]RFA29555.1 FHA domain-containing protein [Subtercola boreus]
MSELTLLVLRFGFLALLWVFVFVIVYAMRSDLFGQRVRKMRDPSGTAAAGAAGSSSAPPAAAVGAAAPAQAAPAVQGVVVGAAASATRLPEPSHPPTPAPQSKVPVFTPLEGSSAGVHPRATTSNAHKLVITSGTKSGTEIELGVEPLTIGRSTDSSVVIRDDYTSTHHARLLNWNNEWVIQDLDSTNGTYLDGKRITQPAPVPLNTPVRIGSTSFELRR